MTAPADHKALAERLERAPWNTATVVGSEGRSLLQDTAAALRAAPAQSLPAGVGREALARKLTRMFLARRGVEPSSEDWTLSVTEWSDADELLALLQPPPPEPAACAGCGLLGGASRLHICPPEPAAPPSEGDHFRKIMSRPGPDYVEPEPSVTVDVSSRGELARSIYGAMYDCPHLSSDKIADYIASQLWPHIAAALQEPTHER